MACRALRATALSTAEFYGLGQETAKVIVEEVVSAIDGWETGARAAGISGADILVTGSAFSAHASHRVG